MYKRKYPRRAGGRHVRRRAGSKLPLYIFLLAILAFALALTLPPEEEGGPAPLGRTLSARTAPEPSQEPVLPEEGDAPDRDSWNLTLVNPWNPLPESRTIRLKQITAGHYVDERCHPDLQAMLEACREAGCSPVICSSYRTWEKQEALFQNKVQRLMAQGYAGAEAEAEAGKAVAVPGTSEHQLGLAVDIVDLANQNLDESQEDTAVQQWLLAHSWEYGFILRYPQDKSGITGIIYEPWHYRYVGKEAAKEIYEQGICLEEYLA